ncbi:MAG: ribosomal protein S18-alanine N-acetyltransferase [Zestosphaera sp.]
MDSDEGLKCLVRGATFNDLSAVMRIERRSFRYPYPETVFLSTLILHPQLFLVIECGETVAGYITGYITSEGCCHIASVAVDPSLRRKGLGRMLLKTFEGRCVEAGAEYVWLEVSVFNDDAIRLYRKLGYEVVDRLPNYYPDSDAYLMRKLLKTQTS